MSKKSWLDYEHPTFTQFAPRWAYAKDLYSGEVLDAGKICAYLIRKQTAEALPAFEERVALADYTNHFGTVVDSLIGMLFAVEADANRVTMTEKQSGLGDLEEDGSIAYRLWDNADGNGIGWLTFWKQVAIEAMLTQLCWVLVDTDVQGNAIVKLFPALSVTNWLYTDGVLTEVLVKEAVDGRLTLGDDPGDAKLEQWIKFTLSGWERWQKNKDGEPIRVVGESSEGTYTYEDAQGQSVLPIYPVLLPFDRLVGWSLARKANVIFNKESERDALLRSSGFPRLKLAANDNQYDKMKKDIAAGSNLLQDDPSTTKTHDYIAPPTDSAAIMNETLARKVEEFYVTAFREYGDAAKERTATEVRQDVASGVGAFLNLLRDAIDDAENNAFYRVAQTEMPTERGNWFVSRVERSDDFIPPDLNTIINKQRDRYFGKEGVIPIGRTALINLSKQAAAWDGLAFDENEIKASIDITQLETLATMFDALPVPASVKVDMTLDLLISLGKIDPEAKVMLDDEAEVLVVDQLRNEMLDLAESKERAGQLLAESFVDSQQEGPPKKKEDDDDDD